MRRSRFTGKLVIGALKHLTVLALLAMASGAAGAEPPSRIAIAATLSGPAANIGEALVEGARIAIEEAGPDAPPVELVITDDQGSAEEAKALARRIAGGDAVAVLGPSLSPIAPAVDTLYAEAGLAVIGTFANDETTGIFRLNLGQSRVGEMLADYLYFVLGGRRAAVLYSEDGFGQPLARGFRYGAERLGITASYHPVTDAAQAEAMARQLALDPEQPAVILGLNEAPAIPVLMTLRRFGVQGPILATPTLAHDDVARHFADEQEEHDSPGFFTDGLYAAAPVLLDSGNAALLGFVERFRARRGHDPNWRVVLAYDAMRLILGALDTARRKAPPDIAAWRRAVREAIAGLNSPPRAVIGLSGPIWFDVAHGRPMATRMGRFNKSLLESAPLQLVPVRHPDAAALEAGAMVAIGGGRFAVFQQVVYAGIHLNEIPQLDVLQSSFAADFYLWLRSAANSRPGAADPAEIQFPDMLRGEFDPGRPAVRHDLPDGSTYRLWRVRGQFHANYNLRRFPFDSQTLALRLYNTRAASEQIIYALDRRVLAGSAPAASGNMVSAMASPMPPEPAAGFPADPAAFDELTQWRVLRVEARHDALVTHSALGDPLRLDTERVRELSGFRLEIELRRRTIATIEKNFLPIGLMTLIMFTSLWFPPALVRDKVAVALASTLSGAVLLASINNQLGNVGYTIAVEYAFYVFFALAVLCIVAVLLAERLRVVKQEGLALRTERAMRVVFVLTVAGTAFAGWFAANH